MIWSQIIRKNYSITFILIYNNFWKLEFSFTSHDIYEDEEESTEPSESTNQKLSEGLNNLASNESSDNISSYKPENMESKSKPKEFAEDNVKSIFYEEENVDRNYICHRLYQKDFIIDLENLPFTPFYKLKTKNKVFSFIGVK